MTYRLGLRLALGSLLGAVALGPLAQSSSASYRTPRQSIDAGAGRAASSSFTVVGSIGQPDAAAAMAGGGFVVRGGFHRAVPATPTDALFANGFEP